VTDKISPFPRNTSQESDRAGYLNVLYEDKTKECQNTEGD